MSGCRRSNSLSVCLCNAGCEHLRAVPVSYQYSNALSNLLGSLHLALLLRLLLFERQLRELPCVGSGKHTLWEGGVRGTALIHSKTLLPLTEPVDFSALMHVSDWLPTILSALSLPPPEKLYKLDGVSQWDAIVSASHGKASEGSRKEVFIFWDPLPIAFNNEVGDAPKSAIRIGQYKLILGPPGCVSSGWIPRCVVAML